MKSFSPKNKDQQNKSVSSDSIQTKSKQDNYFVDNSPEAIQMRQLQSSIDNSDEVKQMMAYNSAFQKNETAQLRKDGSPKEENKTGLPDNLKSGMENLSGVSLNDVKVHRNSEKPAQLQAHAYAQGTDIHLASGQEKHLPHELGHVVQQKQGRVKPTMQMKDQVNVNDDAILEKEADVMGAKAQKNASTYNATISNQENTNNSNTIQRYTISDDGKFNISENNLFAVENTNYPNSIFVSDGAPMPLPGGLAWVENGSIELNGITFKRFDADVSAYEKENGPGTEKFCGQFASGLAGKNQKEDQSTAEPGEILYDEDTSPELEYGWENHYATVVIKDGGDHATFETAVGIEEMWAGIYGSEKGQTFKYKTQSANIDRMMTMPDFIIPAKTKIEQTFWQWIFGKSGKEVVKEEEVRIPQGITVEQGLAYKDELEAWKKDGTPPTSEFMNRVIIRLEQELETLK
ncbi:MAG: DUF4157 domain-containing protein [Saprospiraceae bacterium]|nr:DUF4157 domain-containing protein [Saprospiraceae bacterium]